jgi:putative Ca2+/H+ antiporter (TMEM165/GDT1 family)
MYYLVLYVQYLMYCTYITMKTNAPVVVVVVALAMFVLSVFVFVSVFVSAAPVAPEGSVKREGLGAINEASSLISLLTGGGGGGGGEGKDGTGARASDNFHHAFIASFAVMLVSELGDKVL